MGTRRRKSDYVMVLDFIRSHCNEYLDINNLNNNLRKIMADFEIALWQAIREIRGNGQFREDLEIKGCYFHLTQAVFRKVIQHNLQADYYHKGSSGLRIYIKWLMALVLLPKNLIASTFKMIYDKIKRTNCENLVNLFTYYEKTWINNSNWGIDVISQWRNHVRTNDDAERFHMKLMNSVNKCNVDFYELINILGGIGNVIPVKICQVPM